MKSVTKALANLTRRKTVMEQVKSQEKGIPYEYEFGSICWWLGRCSHLQFIDTRPEFPYLTKTKDIAYPDIFAVFQSGRATFPCLVEVKVRNSQQLKFTPSYVRKLKNYPLAAKYPLLVAWRWRGFWALFDIDTFRSPADGVKVKIADATKASIMDMVVGNFTFEGFKEGVEWSFALKPEGDIARIREGKVNSFRGKIVSFSVSDPSSGRSMRLSNALISLLPFLGEWVPFDNYTDTLVLTGERNQFPQLGLPAYRGLVLSTAYWKEVMSKRLDWKDMLSKRDFLFSVGDVKKVIREGGKKKIGFEHGIMNIRPSISNPCLEHTLIDEFKNR